MSIIRYTKDENIRYAYLNIFPDQFKTEKQKQEDAWVKNTMDYFANKAYANREKDLYIHLPEDIHANKAPYEKHKKQHTPVIPYLEDAFDL